MAAIKPIRTERDYDDALARIEQIFQAEVGTPEGDERDVLVDLVELYEQRHHPIDPPSAIAAIEHEMDQRGLSRRDLIPLIGGSAKVSEVLSGKRDITMTMARALHQHLGIPADALLQKSGASAEDDLSELDPLRFPLSEMAKRGWIPDVPDSETKHYAAELIAGPGWSRRRAGPERRTALPHERPLSYERQDRPVCAQSLVLAGPGPGQQTTPHAL